jgi:hypothetical protein
MPEVVYQVENSRNYHAEQQTGHQGKVKREILAAVIYVARQMPERQMSSTKPYEKQSQNHQDCPTNYQKLSQVTHDPFSAFRLLSPISQARGKPVHWLTSAQVEATDSARTARSRRER